MPNFDRPIVAVFADGQNGSPLSVIAGDPDLKLARLDRKIRHIGRRYLTQIYWSEERDDAVYRLQQRGVNCIRIPGSEEMALHMYSDIWEYVDLHPDLPVVIVTANPSFEYLLSRLLTGERTHNVVLLTTAAMMDSKIAQAADTVLQWEDVHVDKNAHTVDIPIRCRSTPPGVPSIAFTAPHRIRSRKKSKRAEVEVIMQDILALSEKIRFVFSQRIPSPRTSATTFTLPLIGPATPGSPGTFITFTGCTSSHVPRIASSGSLDQKLPEDVDEEDFGDLEE